MWRKAFIIVLVSICINKSVTEDTEGTGDSDNKFAFIVSLQKVDTGHYCGGFLLTPIWVGTAAQCVISKYTDQHIVVAGIFENNEKNITLQKRSVDLFYRHRYYSGMRNDVGLVKVKKPFKFEVNLGLGILPINDTDGISKCSVINWGKPTKDSNKMFSSHNVEHRNHKSCLSSFKDLTESNICFSQVIDAGSCEGYLGGPIVCDLSKDLGEVIAKEEADKWIKNSQSASGTWRIVGIYSEGKVKCGAKDVPNVHTRVLSHRKWLLRAINSSTKLEFYTRTFILSIVITNILK